MKKLSAIVVAAFLLFSLFIGLTVTTSAAPVKGDQLDFEIRNYIDKEGQLVGISYNEWHDHVLFIEVHDWTLMMCNGTVIWAVPGSDGKFIPTMQVILFEDYVWDFVPYLESNDNCNMEVSFLYHTEWYEPDPEIAR